MYNKINVAVIGATGYTGLDLVLMLSKHPKVKIKYLCATKNLGKKISFFDKRIKKKLPKLSSVKKIKWEKLNLVFNHDFLVDLSAVNEKLWDIEEAIRVCEKEKEFGSKFVDLARSIYKINDQRSRIKREINESFGSQIIEEKWYR